MKLIIENWRRFLQEDLNDVYYELSLAIDKLSQLMLNNTDENLKKRAVKMFKINGWEGEEDPKLEDTIDTGPNRTSLKDLIQHLKERNQKNIEQFKKENLPISTELANKYTNYISKVVVNVPFAKYDDVIKKIRNDILDDYKSSSGGGVHPRKGEGVNIDSSLKIAWKKQASRHPDYWNSWSTWTSLTFTKDASDQVWFLTFEREIKQRLSDQQPLSCVGAPFAYNGMNKQLAQVISGVGGLGIQVKGEITWASAYDSNTEHTRKYDKDVKNKTKSVDLEYIEDRMIGTITKPEDEISEGSYNEIIVEDWKFGNAVRLAYDPEDELRDCFDLIQTLYSRSKQGKKGYTDNMLLAQRKESGFFRSICNAAVERSYNRKWKPAGKVDNSWLWTVNYFLDNIETIYKPNFESLDSEMYKKWKQMVIFYLEDL
jgi:hypothetical protein